MTSCRAERRIVPWTGVALAGPIAVCLMAVSAAPGWAQAISKPIPLTPPGQGAVPSPAVTSPPSTGSPPSTVSPYQTAPAAPRVGRPVRPVGVERLPVSSETAKPGEATVAPVQANPLRPIDTESLGVLTEANGGFGATIWVNTRRDIVEALLSRLPVAVTAPSLQDLARRLLLSVGAPPEGERGQRSLMAIRVERSFARGDLAGAGDLVRVTPAREVDAAMAEVRASALLLNDDTNGACQEARTRFGGGPGGLFWDKLNVFCDLLAKDGNKAQLGLALVRDQGEKDQAFFILADALAGNANANANTKAKAKAKAKAEVKAMPNATPLTLAMMRASRQPLLADTGPRDKPAILRGIALSPNAPAPLRLETALRAAQFGALEPAELAQMFAAAEFAPAQIASAFSEAPKLGGARARALLYRAAAQQTVPQARAEALRALYTLGRRDGDFPVLARVTLKQLLELPATRDLAWFAADAGRALYSAGRFPEAKAWLDLAVAEAGHNRDANAAVTALWPLARLADGDGATPWDAERMKEWRRAAETGKPEIAARRIGMMLTLLDLYGEPILGVDWQPLLKAPPTMTGPMPSPMLWFVMREASGEKRLGETVLHVLSALGDTDLGKQNAYVVASAIAALKAIGLDREARALTVDAAIAAGL